ncbi:MAG: HNH endonuclease [bacterium]
MSERITDSLRNEIENRAGSRCEYCRLPQQLRVVRFPVDHIIAIKHSGKTEESNLALACSSCNLHKGSDITSIDPNTGKIVTLFNPRINKWEEHFYLDIQSGRIEGKTPEGRVTTRLLQFNTTERIQERTSLLEIGEFWEG